MALLHRELMSVLLIDYQDSKVHVAAPGVCHVGPVNLAIRVVSRSKSLFVHNHLWWFLTAQYHSLEETVARRHLTRKIFSHSKKVQLICNVVGLVTTGYVIEMDHLVLSYSMECLIVEWGLAKSLIWKRNAFCLQSMLHRFQILLAPVKLWSVGEILTSNIQVPCQHTDAIIPIKYPIVEVRWS